MDAQYLGDSVYVQEDRGWPQQIVLYLNNGGGDEHPIYLDPDVVAALLKYLEAHRTEHNLK